MLLGVLVRVLSEVEVLRILASIVVCYREVGSIIIVEIMDFF